ncbi:hypothetical protein [Salinibacter phage 4_17]
MIDRRKLSVRDMTNLRRQVALEGSDPSRITWLGRQDIGKNPATGEMWSAYVGTSLSEDSLNKITE